LVLPNLDKLKLEPCGAATAFAQIASASSLTNLKELEICDNSGRWATFPKLTLPNLEEVYFSGRQSAKSFARMASGGSLTSLRELKLFDQDGPSEWDEFDSLLLPSLEKLEFRGKSRQKVNGVWRVVDEWARRY